MQKWLPALVALCVTLCFAWARTPLKRDNTPIRPSIPKADRTVAGRVFLERADELRKGRMDSYQEVVGNVMFRKGGMFMYCDSALFFDNDSLEAYGNVRMQQGDTLFVYADRLVYGDTTQLATLYADFGKVVRLINRDVTLTTEIFNYDLGQELGYYEVGGTLSDKSNRLTSLYGEYSPPTKEAIFVDRVHLHSLRPNDTLDIYTELMLYNTVTHVATLDTTSTIISRDGTIYTTQGEYNTNTQVADLFSRSLVKAKNGNTLTGDTLFYDRVAGFGRAMGNIELYDSANSVILTGDEGFYYEQNDSARVWGRALARQFAAEGDADADTLYMHADTIRTFLKITPRKAPEAEKPASVLPVATDSTVTDSTVTDSLGIDIQPIDSAPADSLAANMLPADSVPSDTVSPTQSGIPEEITEVAETAATDTLATPLWLGNDSTHYIIAAPHVRFYRTDLQGLCDSLTLVQRDSILYLDKHPVVWSDNRQIFGNEIQVHLNDSTADWARLPDFGFMAEHIAEEFYSQMTGKEMYATFKGKTIDHLDVSGNVQAIYLPQENDSTYNKIANVESSFLAADFKDQTIERMKMWPETSGTMTPLYLAKKSLFYLPQFRWFEPLRPKAPHDVFVISKEMLDLMAEPPFGSRGAN